jgi:hypothetical protein
MLHQVGIKVRDGLVVLATHCKHEEVVSFIEGAFFQIKMTPNQITMTAYEEDAFLIIFLRFDSNSLTRIKSANLG